MPVDTITLELPDSSGSILFHEDLKKLENKLENWFPAATYLLQLYQRQQKPDYTARQEQTDVIDRFLDRLALLFANTKKTNKTPRNVTATGLTQDTKAKCWNVYIAKNDGPQGEDAKFAETLQKWLNRSDDEELVVSENNESWKALLKFWNERIDFYSRKAPSWDSIESHRVEINRYFEKTDKLFDSAKFNEEWEAVVVLLGQISNNAWPKYLNFWRRSARQSYSPTARQGCPVWVENYCTYIHYLEMLAMPRSMWSVMVEFRELKAENSVEITLVQKPKLSKLEKDARKHAIANALEVMNEKIKTRKAQEKLKESNLPEVYLHCELQILLLFYQLEKKNANLKKHRFIGCSKLSCHMCRVVLKDQKYWTRGTHSKISANWSFQLPSDLEGLVKSFTNLHSEWKDLFRQHPDCNFKPWPQQKDTDPAATQRFDLKPFKALEVLQGDLGLKRYSDPHEQYTDEQCTDELCPYQTILGQKPGRGAFAKVYQAERRNKNDPQQFFALKEILVKDESWLKDVTAEIKILKKPLRHTNILRLEEAFYSNLNPCKVYLATLPWAPQSMYDFFWTLLEMDPSHDYAWYAPEDLGQWPSIVFQCSRGLAYLHSEGIKHKDLKPHNILLLQEKNQNGIISIRPIIADFGISKNFKPGGETDRRGTNEFMAPEQFGKIVGSELHSDIWSLGCCFAFIWILLHSRKKGLDDLWEKIMRAKHEERGFHTKPNTKATHELLERSLTLPKDSGVNAFMHDFGALVKNMLTVEPSERPEAWIIALHLIRLEEKWVETQHRQLSITIVETFLQEHPDRLTSMANLESILSNEGPRKEVERAIVENADKLYAQVMQTKERAPEKVDSRELDDMANRASELFSQGRSEEAERLYVQVMELRRMVQGREHQSTLYSMAALANMYWRLYWVEKGELLSLPLVEMSERVLGEDHQFTLTCMLHVVHFWWRRGYYDKALQLVDEVFKRSKKLGPNHRGTLRYVESLDQLRKICGLEPISLDQHASSE